MANRTKLNLIHVIMALVAPCFAGDVSAGHTKEGHGSLATQATNPAAALIQLQFQNQYVPESDNSSGYANTGIIQPVYPFVLGPDHYFQAIVARLTVPIVTTPKVAGDRTTDLGDSTLLLVATHKGPSGDEGEFFTWGAGLATVIPTANDRATGEGKLSLGPTALALRNYTNVFTNGDSLLVGALAYQTWSVTNGGGPDVSKTFGQPIIVYHFNELFGQKGWYAGTPDDLWEYDWNNKEMFQISAGARLGKVFSIGKQPVNMFLQSWYNPVDSDRGASPDYTIKFNFTFLFPE